MSSLPGQKRAYQDHLRYKHMVARLQKLPAHALETAVLAELAKGKRWRIDAALEALLKDDSNTGRVDVTGLFETAGRFGRLTAMHRLVKAFGAVRIDRSHAANRVPSTGVYEAFDLAVINGHYRVADFLRAYGAGPDHIMRGNRSPRAMTVAVIEGDVKKLGYLLSCGVDPAAWVEGAIYEGKPAILTALLNAGADVNEVRNGYGTPLNLAARLGDKGVVDLLLARGARVDACWDTLLFDCVAAENDPVIFDTLVAHGALPDETVLGRALYAGLPQYVTRVFALGLPARPETLVAAITSPRTSDALVEACIAGGVSVQAALALVNRRDVTGKEMERRDEVLARLRALTAREVAPPKPPAF